MTTLVNQRYPDGTPDPRTVRKVKASSLSAAATSGLIAPIAVIISAGIAGYFPVFASVEMQITFILTAVLTSTATGLMTWWAGYQTKERL